MTKAIYYIVFLFIKAFALTKQRSLYKKNFCACETKKSTQETTKKTKGVLGME